MAQSSKPWDLTLTGDAGPYNAGQWQNMYMYMFGALMQDLDGFVFPGSGATGVDPLYVRSTAAPSTSVRIAPGAAMVRGIYYRSDEEETVAIPSNLSGNPRIDRIVLRADYSTQQVRIHHLQGTPAGSPTAPALTENDGVVWDLPLATVAVANGFLTITDANITNETYWHNTDIFTPPGALIAHAGAIASNTGWLICNGQAVSRTQFRRLFAVIGTTYGAGDGATTFNVPDLRGRFPLGRDNMGGVSANRVTAVAADSLGGSGGAETHTLTVSEMPAHQHGVYTAGLGSTNLNGLAGGTQSTMFTQPQGGGAAHNNLPPYLTINWYVKY